MGVREGWGRVWREGRECGGEGVVVKCGNRGTWY